MITLTLKLRWWAVPVLYGVSLAYALSRSILSPVSVEKMADGLVVRGLVSWVSRHGIVVETSAFPPQRQNEGV